MRIAFISLEYPPDTAFGGIATYVYQVSLLLRQRGHEVEVFTASKEKEGRLLINDIPVHYIRYSTHARFREEIVPVFSRVHEQHPFEIIESPEFNADGLAIKEKYPELPLAVKLHTPGFWVNKLNQGEIRVPLLRKLRIFIGAYRRLQKPERFWAYDKNKDVEYQLLMLADYISSPSVSLKEIVQREWGIAREKIEVLPYPFLPSRELLSIPIDTETKTILYVGRLEIRKGVALFAEIVPLILQKHPDWRFLFVGSDLPGPEENETMKAYLQRRLKPWLNRVEFREAVKASEIASVYAQADICVFPSKWENFPNVCLEAMSAGRAIVASRQGGMEDMLAKPRAGLLFDPEQPVQLLEKLEEYITDPALRRSLGTLARRLLQERYNGEEIGKRIETAYGKIIRREPAIRG